MTTNMRIEFPVNTEADAITALVPVDNAPSATYLMNRTMFQSFNRAIFLNFSLKPTT